MKMICISASQKTPVVITLFGNIKVKQDGDTEQLRGAGPHYHVFDKQGLYIKSEPYIVTAKQNSPPASPPPIAEIDGDAEDDLTILPTTNIDPGE